jgi:hypothetical protein
MYKLEQWVKPDFLPDGGIAIPTNSRRDFYHHFMTYDTIWEMTQAQRETWKNEILGNWDSYKFVISVDGTGAYHQQLRDMDRMGGALILIPGDMGTGKSIIALTHLKMWNYLKGNDDPPHVFWSKNEVRAKIRKTANNTAHSIDEDMRATGSGSGNLEIHLKNLFETIRKTGKLVIDVGVNAAPAQLGRAVGLQLLPFGFNRVFQANRFVVCNWKKEPLWLATSQRFYFPEEPLFYEGELGTFGEYSDRALEFSTTTTGVFAGSNADQELAWRDELVAHWEKEFPSIVPSMDVLEFEAIQIDIPQESIASISRVCSSSKFIITRNIRKGESGNNEVVITEAGWKGFRSGLYDLVMNKGSTSRDAEALSLYYVPREPKWAYVDIVKEMGLSVLSDSISKAIRARKKEITTKQLGDLGEKFVASQLDIVGGVWGGGGDDVPDVTVGDLRLNVKTTLADSVRKHEPTTPENQWDNSLVVLLLPRLLECRLFPITGEHTAINSRKGRLVAIETLAQNLKGVK